MNPAQSGTASGIGIWAVSTRPNPGGNGYAAGLQFWIGPRLWIGIRVRVELRFRIKAFRNGYARGTS